MSTATASSIDRHSALLWKGAVAAAAIVCVIGLLLQSNTHLNHDIAWILYSVRQMVEGAVFGRDIIAANPPLAWYISLPATVLADLLGVHVATAFRIYVAVLSAGTLVAVYGLLRREPETIGRASGGLLLVTAAYCFFVGSYRDFGQREYLALVLCLPYLLVAALRMDGRPCPRMISIAAGLFAGIGLALKPHFLAVPVLIELTGAVRAGSLRFPLRAETISIAVVIGVYLLSLPILAPAYLFEVIPLVSQVYWGFNNPPSVLFSQIAPNLFGFAVALYLVAESRKSTLQLVLLAAAGGFLIAYVTQMKGYSYHSYPFRVLVLLTLAVEIAALLESGFGERKPRWLLRLCLAGSAFLLTLAFNLSAVAQWYDASNRTNGVIGERTDRLVALVGNLAGSDYFLALSTHPYPGFPVAVYTDAKWASRTNSDFFLPAVARLRADEKDRDSDRLLFAESCARRFILRDLALEPRLVVVDAHGWKHGIGKTGFDIIEFYLEDPAFREVWRSYVEIEGIDGYRAFIRKPQGASS